MKALVETILKALVDHPELVEVNEIVGTKSYTLELKVGPDDVGKIIGKRGRIIDAIRTIVRAASTKEGRRANIEIIEPHENSNRAAG